MSNRSEQRSPLPDLLARLTARASSGRLVVAHPEGSSDLWLDGGRVVRARNPESDRRLNARLLVGGHALASDITKARRAAKGRPLADVLLEKNVARRDVLRSIEAAEARYALAAALAADPEAVSFERDAPGTPAQLLDVDPLDLLAETESFLAGLESAERFAPAWSVPSLPTGLPGPDVALGPEEWAVLTRVDGVATIAAIADQSGFPEAEVSLAVFRLSALGIAAVDGTPSSPATFEDESSLAYLDEIEVPDVEIVNEAPIADAVAGSAEVSSEPHYEAPPEFEELIEAVAAEVEPVVEAEPAAVSSVAVAAFEPDPAPSHPVEAPVSERNPRLDATSPDGEFDTKSLLRELAALARDPADRR